MPFIADFHIHSHYSRATSKEMNIKSLAKWGQIKGIQVMGTGDFTHPAWFQEMRETLEEAEPGLFQLNPKLSAEIQKEVPLSCQNFLRYMLTVEISTIYSKGGKVRKIHSIIAAPSFEVAAKINSKLAEIGNLHSDGRPILGLDAKELLKIVLDASPDCIFIPAHVWTPHFGVLGSGAGFDSLEECFEELTPYITALETGLSSDPAMNWRCTALDNFTLVSNSDAHSPAKLGREANRFDTDLSYFAIKKAVKEGDPQQFLETIEFYPEEGKYHLDGHRNCQVILTPEQSAKLNEICPQCGKKLTIGVMNRVEKLANQPSGREKPRKIPFRYLVPLPEILAHILETSVNSQKVAIAYNSLIQNLGNEFFILLDAPQQAIEKASTKIIAEAIQRVRNGKLTISPGFDGEYGTIKIFDPHEKEELTDQLSLF